MFTHFEIEGQKPLKGTVQISGSKNTALPLIFATLLTDQEVVLKNIPDIADVRTTIEILKYLGSEIHFEDGALKINNSNLEYKEIPGELVNKMRSSIYLLGSMIARFNKVKLPFPGGCVIGKRPIDTHIEGIENLGARIVSQEDIIHLETNQLTGNTFLLNEMSVTGTINVILAAVKATGETKIRLAAPEPEVQAVCHLLNEMGAHIIGIGTYEVIIRGVESLHGAEFSNIPDRIEAGTFACIAAFVDESEVTLTGINNSHMETFWQKMEDINADFSLPDNNTAIIRAKSEYKNLPALKTNIYPHFPTDLQQPFAILLTKAQGISKIFERLFEGRLGYLGEIEKMGAKTEVLNPHQAIIIGKTNLKGASLQSFDLRAGAAVVIAALGARGTSLISGINYIDRGYEKFEEKLTSIGANIKRITQ